jgi:predicted RNase H-like nuclease
MPVVLGIDAAWTASEPSGVALLAARLDSAKCLAVAPSYSEFLAQAAGRKTNWSERAFLGSPPDAQLLLAAARSIAGQPVDLVAIDMPIAKQAFASRRPADDLVSKEFGSRWCSAHTPNASRPGVLGTKLAEDFCLAGYRLRTAGEKIPSTPVLIEVYPHTALLSLLRRSQRVPYKVSKSWKYWPGISVAERSRLLLEQLHAIHDALTHSFSTVGLELPQPGRVEKLSHLKRYEDALDALLCAWMGLEYLNGRAVALGDEDSAIWCPADVVLTLRAGP